MDANNNTAEVTGSDVNNNPAEASQLSLESIPDADILASIDAAIAELAARLDVLKKD